MAETWGPWASGISDAERKARWRALASLVLVYCGGAHPMLRAAIDAEHGGPEAAERAATAFASLGALTRRQLLAAFASVDGLVTVRARR